MRVILPEGAAARDQISPVPYRRGGTMGPVSTALDALAGHRFQLIEDENSDKTTRHWM